MHATKVTSMSRYLRSGDRDAICTILMPQGPHRGKKIDNQSSIDIKAISVTAPSCTLMLANIFAAPRNAAHFRPFRNLIIGWKQPEPTRPDTPSAGPTPESPRATTPHHLWGPVPSEPLAFNKRRRQGAAGSANAIRQRRSSGKEQADCKEASASSVERSVWNALPLPVS